MKARIEKKLSKHLVQLYPTLYRAARIFRDEPTALAYKQGSRVSNVLFIGGDVNCWGEMEGAYSVWDDWRRAWAWEGPFESYPNGHPRQFYPNTEGFRPTTHNLLKLAAKCQLLAVNKARS